MQISFTFRQFCVAQVTVVAIVILLGALSYTAGVITGHFNWLGFLRLLDVGSEQSIPTYISLLNLLLSSALSYLIYHDAKQNGLAHSNYWAFLSALFLALSVDESASIHENFEGVYRYLMDEKLVPPFLDTHQWLPFGALAVVVVSMILVPFVSKLSSDTRLLILVAGLVFITGALGLELVGAMMLETGIAQSKTDTVYLIRRLFEEGCEMYGVVILNCALYREILRRKVTINFRAVQ